MISAVLAAIAPVFAIILAGFWVRRAGVLSEQADASLMRMYVNLLYPCLIATKILGNTALHQSANLWLPPLAGFATMGAGFIICWLGARLLCLPRGMSTRTFTFVTGAYNYVYTSIPIIASLFGDQTMGVLFLFNLGTEVAFWIGTGVILAHRSEAGLWRRIFNVPVISVLTAVALNFLHVRERLGPVVPWAFKAVETLGNTAIPLALLLTGAVVADFLAEARPSWSDAKAFGGACLLRLGFLPLTFLALACFLPCTLELKRVLIVQAAMPAGMFPVALCKHYGGNVGLSVQIVIGTTVLALLTIPQWIALGWRLAL
jgi:predicted permease